MLLGTNPTSRIALRAKCQSSRRFAIMSQPPSSITDMLASVLEQNQTMTDMIVQLSSETLAQHFKLNRLMDDMKDLRSELRAVSSVLGVNAARPSAPREADNVGNVEAGNAQPGAVARRVTQGNDTRADQAVHQAATGAIPAKRTRQDVAPAAPPNGTSEAGPSTSKKARKDSATDPEPQTHNRVDASGSQQDASGSAAAGPSLKYKAGDVVLAKVKGYPEWPGMVRIYTPFSSRGRYREC